MKTFLVFALMLVASITITTALRFTDEELVQLYNTPVDPQAFIDTIFTLPLTEELYVYNYIGDLIRYLSPGSKLQTFLYSAMALMQRKIDDFSARYNLETKPVHDFLINGIDIQLKILIESAHPIMKSTKNDSSKTPRNKVAVVLAPKPLLQTEELPTLPPSVSFPAKSQPNENSFADLAKILEPHVTQNSPKLQLSKRNHSKTDSKIMKTPLLNRNRSLSKSGFPLANSATPASFSV